VSVSEIKKRKVTTERGVALWPKLNEPDTKFKAEGEYSITLRLSGEASQGIKEMCDEMAQAAYDAAVEELNEAIKTSTGKKKVDLKAVLDGLQMQVPYSPDYDDDGNETGDYLFKFKMLASGVNKKTGKQWSRRPHLFDSKGKPLAEGIDVWGGSEVRVAGELSPYFIPGTKTVGCKLNLEAVKIIKLVNGSAHTADGYGFGEEEDGFDAEDAPAPTKRDDGFDGDEGVEADEF